MFLQPAMYESDDHALVPVHAATDAEHGMELAAQAFDQLEREPYGTAHGRIPALCRALEGTPQARVLDERVRSLPVAG